jgi:hypothetical protein
MDFSEQIGLAMNELSIHVYHMPPGLLSHAGQGLHLSVHERYEQLCQLYVTASCQFVTYDSDHELVSSPLLQVVCMPLCWRHWDGLNIAGSVAAYITAKIAHRKQGG